MIVVRNEGTGNMFGKKSLKSDNPYNKLMRTEALCEEYEEEIAALEDEVEALKKECDELQKKLAKYEWTKVLDENPDYDKQVLMYDKDNGYRVVTFEYDDTQNCNTKIFIEGENYYESIGCVLIKDSCWTTLPTPPKENNDDSM